MQTWLYYGFLFNLILIDKIQCKLEGRIIGGHISSINKHPYQLGLVTDGNPNCGAAIVGDEWAVTSAHCVIGRGKIELYAGSTMLKKGTAHEVIRRAVHAKFNRTTLDNDIALLQVVPKFWTSYPTLTTAPVELPQANQEFTQGTIGVISGWGIQESRSKVLSTNLRAVEIPVIDFDLCKQLYPEGEVTENMMCAGFMEGGRDGCQGDSGGPFVINGILAGIISWGDGCGMQEHPGVYTKVSNYRDWLRRASMGRL